MAGYLPPLIESVHKSGVYQLVEKILIVNDGSNDQTSETIDSLKDNPQFGGKIKELNLPTNQGRFWARYLGAKEISTEWTLMVDTRIALLPGFDSALKQALGRGHAAVGWVDIDIHKNIYCLYWQRSHERIFARHFSIDRGPEEPNTLTLTFENYDQYLKGTTLFLCRTRAFIEACKKFEQSDLKSDDTLLMKEMVKTEPILIDTALRFRWEPRSDLVSFLWRLIDRGPGFVEYHIIERKGLFFWVVMTGLVFLFAWILLAVYQPSLALKVLGISIVLLALSAFAFAKGIKEWLRIWSLHILVVFSFGIGVIWGLVFVGWRAIKTLLKKAS